MPEEPQRSWARTPLWENADYAIFSGAQEPYIVVFEWYFNPCGDGYWQLATAGNVPLAIRALIDERDSLLATRDSCLNREHMVDAARYFAGFTISHFGPYTVDVELDPSICVSRCCQ